MLYFVIFVCVVSFCIRAISKLLFRYIPKNSKSFYDEIFATRGIVSNSRPNTKEAFKDIMGASYMKGTDKYKFGIVIDLRLTQDKKFVCFQDKYTRRLTGVPGSIASKTYGQLKTYRILNNDNKYSKNSKICSFANALSLINKKNVILINLSFKLNLGDLLKLVYILKKYDGKFCVSCSSLSNYKYFKRVFINGNIFFKYNIFQKRLNIIREKAYRGMNLPNYDEVVSMIGTKFPKLNEIVIPSALDIALSVMDSTDTIKAIIRGIWSISNRYTTRVKNGHFLLSKKIAHRAIYTKKYPENSSEAINECCQNDQPFEIDVYWHKFVKFKTILKCCICFLKRSITFKELCKKTKDFLLFKGEVRVGHKGDKIAEIFGQEKSCVGRLSFAKSMTLISFLKVVDSRVFFILDVKDFNIFSRYLIKNIVNELDKYRGKYVIQSFNPLCLRWLYKNRPHIIRGIVGHSLKGIRDKIPETLFLAINFCLFYYGHPDYVVYDININVNILSLFNKIIGLPVFGYAPTREVETLSFLLYFANFICEDLGNKKAWPNYKRR